MGNVDTGRRRAALGLLGLPALGAASLVAGCAIQGGTVAPPPGAEPLPVPALRVGDRWRYRILNMYARGGAPVGETTVEVVSTSPDIRLRVDPGGGAAALEERWVDPWTVAVDAGFDVPMVFESPVPVVPAGARTGMSMRTLVRYRSDRTSRVLNWQQSLRVFGWQRIQVPAGEFDALRIDRLITFEHPDPFRLGADRTDVLWYAPEVRRWVAREWTGTYMPGSPTSRAGRAREDWLRWELTGWKPGA
jgi:hypothetical protein